MNDSFNALGKRIRTFREKAGLTQLELAEKAQLSPKHLGEIERGRGNPSWSSVEKLAQALGVFLLEILDFEHERLPAAEIRARTYQMVEVASDDECRLLYRICKALFK